MQALKWLFSKPGATKGAPAVMMGKGELARRLIPDVGFAALSAATTPGDLGDKLIVGGTQLVGSTGLGLAAGRLAGRNQLASELLDQGFSIAGDFASMPVADMAMRGKDKLLGGEGMTAWERLSAEQQKLLAQQIEQNVLQAYGLLPGTRNQYFQDPSTGQGVA